MSGNPVTHLLDESVSILPVRHMRTAERYPPDPRNGLKPWVHTEVRDLVSFAVHEKRLHFDFVSLSPAFPALDRANNDELGWTLTTS